VNAVSPDHYNGTIRRLIGDEFAFWIFGLSWNVFLGSLVWYGLGMLVE
jgi:hypothetical protein